MANVKEKRKRIEELILNTISLLEIGDKNKKRYEAMFATMDDKAFSEWASKFDEKKFDQCIQVFALPFEEPTFDNIKRAADYLNLPLEEYIYYRDIIDGEEIRTKIKVPVGYVHVKRVQQLLTKKNRYSFNNKETSLKTGQVTGDSKVAAVSDNEGLSLSVINANKAIEELYGPRADNQIKKLEMYKAITNDGFFKLSDLTNDPSSSTTLNTINTYMLGSGIQSDLIEKGLKTTYTIKNDLKK